MKTFNSIGDVLRSIIKDRGEQVLRNPKLVMAMFGDYAPEMKKEKGLLKAFCEENGFEKILEMKNASESRQNACMNKLVDDLMRNEWLAKEASQYVCKEVYEAITGKEWIFDKEKTVSTAPKSSDSQSSVQVTPPSPYQMNSHSSNKKWLIIAAAICILVVIIIFASRENKKTGYPPVQNNTSSVVEISSQETSSKTEESSKQNIQESSQTTESSSVSSQVTEESLKQEESSKQEVSEVQIPHSGALSYTRGTYLSANAKKISASAAEASSELYTSTETFYASYAIDGDVTTSWQECAPDSYGAGEWLKISYPKTEVINVIGFNLGNQGGQQWFRENGVPKTLLIETSSGDSIQCSFEWIFTTQYVYFSRPVEASWIKITLKDFFPAALYTDTVISEVTAYYDETYAIAAVSESKPMIQTGGLNVCVNSNGVNVRKGPGTNYDVVDVLSEGKNLTVLEMTPDTQWGRFEVNGESGWINLGLVDYTSGQWNDFPVYYATSCITSLHNWENLSGGAYHCNYCDKYRKVEDGKVYSSNSRLEKQSYLYDAQKPSKVDKYQ